MGKRKFDWFHYCRLLSFLNSLDATLIKVSHAAAPRGHTWQGTVFSRKLEFWQRGHTRTADVILHLNSSSLPQKDRSRPQVDDT